MTTSNFSALPNRYRMTFLLSVIFFLCIGVAPTSAQGWERYYGGEAEDIGEALIATSDWGFLMVGNSESFGVPGNQDVSVYAIKVDVDGDLVWQQVYDPAFYERGKAVVELENGGFMIAAEASDLAVDGPFSLMMLEIEREGALLNTFSYSLDEVPSLRINDMISTPDGGFLVVGFADYFADKDDDIAILKLNAAMELEWHKIIDAGSNDRANAVALIDGGYVITGQVDGEVPPPTAFGDDVLTIRLDAAGEIIWQQKIVTNQNDEGNGILVDEDGDIVITGSQGSELGMWKYNSGGTLLQAELFDFYGNGNVGEAIIEAPEGGYVVAGFTEVDGSDLNQLILGVNKDLELQWNNDNGDPQATDVALAIAKAQSGGYAIAGWSGILQLFVTDLSLVKTDNQGQVISNVIKGKVFRDLDAACDLDSGEPTLSGWLVRATGPSGTYFDITDAQGNYEMRVDSGSYLIETLIRNDYWESCFPGGVNIGFNQIYDTLSVDFPLKANYIDCPLMGVEVSTPFISNCTDIEYTISYANDGTGGTNGEAWVEVELDPALSFLSASLPFTLSDGVFTFQLGEVAYNSSGSFKVNTAMDCDEYAVDQAALVSAHIYPDTVCTPADPGWNGASVSVDGVCENGEEVTFRISNTGDAAMVSAKSYFIVEEDLMFLTNGFDLDEEQDTTIVLPATGSTYRIIAEQVDGHPGNNFPTRAVEGCGTDEDGGYSVGYVTQWPENDADRSVSIHVDEVLETVPDVALTAHPKGWQDSLITAETELTYRVYFKNITQDSVIRVVVRDTLPEALDLSTISFGASSHPATFDVYDNGVIKATFEDLELPADTETLSTEDYAYFEYRVAQKPGNPQGTVIENRALVIYDYNTPVYTKVVRHVIDAPTYADLLEVIPVDVDEPSWASGVEVAAFPNPATDYVTLDVRGLEGQHELSFTLMNLLGQPVRSIDIRGNQCTFDRKDLPAGSYIYLVRADGQKIAAGTLVIR